MTIRLAPATIDRIAEIVLDLRRSGIRPRQATASEIVTALIEEADVDALRSVLRRRKKKT